MGCCAFQINEYTKYILEPNELGFFSLLDQFVVVCLDEILVYIELLT